MDFHFRENNGDSLYQTICGSIKIINPEKAQIGVAGLGSALLEMN